MSIKFTPKVDVTLPNYYEQLETVQDAITSCLVNGQQYAITGSRSKQSVSLSELQKERTRLERLIKGLENKTPGRNYADNSGYYGNHQSDLQGE